MVEISDELLMAYADNALDPATSATVEAALEKQPQYRELVEIFRSTRHPIRIALREGLETIDLGPLIDRIRRDEFTAPKTDSARVVRIYGDKTRAHGYRFRQHLPLAMAASIALLIGATLGWSLNMRPAVTTQLSGGFVRFSDGGLLAEGALGELLEHATSDTYIMAKTEDGKVWRLNTSFTFRSVKRSPCRRYEIDGNVRGRFAGYACRTDQGQWLIQAHAGVGPKGQNSGYIPAAGDGDTALEAALRATMDGDAYQSSEEAELISRRWTIVGK